MGDSLGIISRVSAKTTLFAFLGCEGAEIPLLVLPALISTRTDLDGEVSFRRRLIDKINGGGGIMGVLNQEYLRVLNRRSDRHRSADQVRSHQEVR